MITITSPAPTEAVERFSCLGGTCTVRVRGRGACGDAPGAASRARRRLLEWHRQFSRFDPASELSRLNDDPRERVPVSPMMARFVQCAVRAAAMTHGLVDPTLVGELEAAGYVEDLVFSLASSRPGADQLAPRRPAAARPDARWKSIRVDMGAGIVSRPPGLRLDSGGVAKGLFADVLAGLLRWHETFSVDAAGDVVLGGRTGASRQVQVAAPFSERVLHTFQLAQGAVATSGITRRAWMDGRGRPAHHLLDPSTGEPAFTGVVQATALAPSGLEAEALAKAVLLSGPDGGHRWLLHGGVLVYDDGAHEVIDP